MHKGMCKMTFGYKIKPVRKGCVSYHLGIKSKLSIRDA